MTRQTGKGRGSHWLVKLALALGGTSMGLLLAQGAVILFPGLLPRFLRPNELFTLRASQSDEVVVTYRVVDGDLFVAQPGSITPPRQPSRVLATHTLSFDEDGFRRPLIEARRYPILAIGDSFTIGAQVSRPWPDVLADELHTPVRNLGVGGYNPPDYAEVMNRFGTEEAHDWVVIGFYEGNDMRGADDDETTLSLPRVLRETTKLTTEKWVEPDYGEGPWKYPIDMQLGDRTRPLVFFEPHLWVLNGVPKTYTQSREMETLSEYLDAIQQDAGDACVLLVFFPGKPHVYFPHVEDPEDQIDVLENARRIDLDDTGIIFSYRVPTTFDEILSRMDSMSVAVGDLAQQKGIHFLDVTPHFEAAASDGVETYYTYDTHWNQRGHDTAGEAIAGYIQDHPECGPANGWLGGVLSEKAESPGR